MPSSVLGGNDAQLRGAKLPAVGGVVDPVARAFEILPRMDRRGAAHDRHQIPLAPDGHAQDAEAALGTMEGHPLDSPR